MKFDKFCASAVGLETMVSGRLSKWGLQVQLVGFLWQIGKFKAVSKKHSRRFNLRWIAKGKTVRTS
jgi:hypothetical protein